MGPADVEVVRRIGSARIVAAPTRFTGDFGPAEDAAQEVVAGALAVGVFVSSGGLAGADRFLRRGHRLEHIRSVSGAADEQIRRYFADVLLGNVVVAIAAAVDSPGRARLLCGGRCGAVGKSKGRRSEQGEVDR